MKTARLFSLLMIAVLAFAGCQTETTTTNPETSKSTSGDSNSDDSAADDSTADDSDSKEEFVIDVRSKAEWDTGHLEQAVLIPHTEIAEKISGVTGDKSAKIVVYCKAGSRAGRAKKTLEGMGYTNVENAGGIEEAKKRYEK